MPRMPDAPERPRVTTLTPLRSPAPARPDEDRMVCERCGQPNVYRMHAVWRCADCGFKTDCCGW